LREGLSRVTGSISPEASAAVMAYQGAKESLYDMVQWCSSGKELIKRDYREDVRLACQLNSDATAPMMIDLAYQNVALES